MGGSSGRAERGRKARTPINRTNHHENLRANLRAKFAQLKFELTPHQSNLLLLPFDSFPTQTKAWLTLPKSIVCIIVIYIIVPM